MALTFSDLNCEVVAEAANVHEAVDFIESHPDGIDLAMLDYFLPDGNGHDIIRVLKSVCPQAKTLLITGEVDKPEIMALANEGINGIISKDVQSANLTAIVSSIMQEDNKHLKTDKTSSGDYDLAASDFSEREIEIIRLCIKGMSAKQIATTLDISPRTVEHHKERIFKKSGCNSAMDLLKYAMRNGLLVRDLTQKLIPCRNATSPQAE